MRRILLWAPMTAFAVVLAIVASGLWAPADRTVRSALIGQPAPVLRLPAAVQGKPAKVAGPRLINVFASWCVPCAAESPQLLAIQASGVAIEGIAVRDAPADLRRFLDRYGDPYAAIGDDRQGRFQLAIGSAGVPESFVVDSRGKIVLQHVGDIRAEHVAAIVAAVRDAR